MSSYFISPPEKTTWTFDADTLARALCTAWPTAHVERISDPSSFYQLRWKIESGLPAQIEGTLANDGQTVHLDGDLRSAVAVARWYRSVVPSQQALIFYDEGFSADVRLTAQVTEDQLAQPFLASM